MRGLTPIFVSLFLFAFLGFGTVGCLDPNGDIGNPRAFVDDEGNTRIRLDSLASEDASIWGNPAPPTIPPIDRDWRQIAARDTLVLLAPYNSTTYFLYRGEPMGYEYELIRRFARANDLYLQTRVVRDRDSLFYLLNRGDGDIAAARLIPEISDSARVAFTNGIYQTRPVLVQQELPPQAVDFPEPLDTLLAQQQAQPVGDDFAPLPQVTLEAQLIESPEELSGHSIHIPSESAYFETLVELADTVTGDIEVVRVRGGVDDEELIRRVARGEIELTVSQENLAQLRESYYQNIAVQPTMGRMHSIAWAVRTNAPTLRQKLNAFLATERRKARFNALYQKYFVDRRGFLERAASEYLTSSTGRLSPYDDLFKKYAPEVGWDWRLLASQAFQESRFKPRAKSWAGAAGLLQLMPRTARQFGVRDRYDPEDNVRGAAKFLVWLENYWDDKIPDQRERLKFIIASYNAGIGHVGDARRLAQKYGANPDVWDEVSYWMLQKSKRKYYKDPVVRYGFARGLEPVHYVAIILERYDHYRQFVES